jgi:hypothetical protein
MQMFQMYNSYSASSKSGNTNHSNGNSKSSSYPSFSTAINQQHQMGLGCQRSGSRDKLNLLIHQPPPQHQQPPQMQVKKVGQMNPNAPPYHRHSLNNLMPPPSLLSIQQPHHQKHQQNPQTDGSLGGSLKSLSSGSSSGCADYNYLIMSEHNQAGVHVKTTAGTGGSIGDINSRLESLCLQMTEQAIN